MIGTKVAKPTPAQEARAYDEATIAAMLLVAEAVVG